jgi:hypothetical protein
MMTMTNPQCTSSGFKQSAHSRMKAARPFMGGVCPMSPTGHVDSVCEYA